MDKFAKFRIHSFYTDALDKSYCPPFDLPFPNPFNSLFPKNSVACSTSSCEKSSISTVSSTLEGTLKDLTPEERLQERQNSVKPLVEEYFTWVKKQLSGTTVLPKGKTADGLKYSVNQKQYLKVFLEDSNVPIDNSASERSIRTFCIGKKNWMFHDSVKGARTRAVIYSLTETAKLNNLRPYHYFKHLLKELPKLCDDEGNIDSTKLDHLLPWSTELPKECRKPRR